MAAKVALTAEEFRENSQRSIDLFNTEKLSTNSTHVLKSAYCNSVHFCRCNLHGACGGKEGRVCLWHIDMQLQSARSVWRQSLAGQQIASDLTRCNLHGACGGKAVGQYAAMTMPIVAICTERVEAKIFADAHGSVAGCCNLHGACGGKALVLSDAFSPLLVAICTERVEAK